MLLAELHFAALEVVCMRASCESWEVQRTRLKIEHNSCINLKRKKEKKRRKKRKKAEVFKVTKLNMISYGLGFQGGILHYFIKD